MPHVPDSKKTRLLLAQSRQALYATQKDLAEMLGVARRTIGRWEGGASSISVPELCTLARAVHKADPSLASAIAAEAGTTLEQLGLASLPKPALPVGTRPSSPRPFPPVELMIDSVVHVAVQALTGAEGAPPVETVQAVLCAALARAKGLGLTLEELEGELSKTAAPTARRPRPPAK